MAILFTMGEVSKKEKLINNLVVVDIFNIDIGILPQSYVSEKPEGGGIFPFVMDGKTPYL